MNPPSRRPASVVEIACLITDPEELDAFLAGLNRPGHKTASKAEVKTIARHRTALDRKRTGRTR